MSLEAVCIPNSTTPSQATSFRVLVSMSNKPISLPAGVPALATPSMPAKSIMVIQCCLKWGITSRRDCTEAPVRYLLPYAGMYGP